MKGERQEESEAKTPSVPFLRGTLSLAPPRLPVRNALADREAWSERQRINRAYSRTYTHRPTFLHVGSHGWQRCGADEEHRALGDALAVAGRRMLQAMMDAEAPHAVAA